jgi:hypothetical protein
MTEASKQPPQLLQNIELQLPQPTIKADRKPHLKGKKKSLQERKGVRKDICIGTCIFTQSEQRDTQINTNQDQHETISEKS